MSTLELHHRATMRRVTALVGCYVGLSVLTLVAAYVLRDTGQVDGAVWIRGGIVAATSLLTLSFAVRAARGNRRMFLRLRIVSAILLVAVVVIAALPGLLPLWMRIEQGVCGLLLLGVVVLVNGRPVRAAFARP
jgi:hypothetical protein